MVASRNYLDPNAKLCKRPQQKFFGPFSIKNAGKLKLTRVDGWPPASYLLFDGLIPGSSGSPHWGGCGGCGSPRAGGDCVDGRD